MLTASPDVNNRDIVKNFWAAQHKGTDFEAWWRRTVHDGVAAGSAFATRTPALKGALPPAPAKPAASGLEVSFRPDPGIYDGRFANNGWLQEMPKPVTKLTWDNAAVISPATAHKLNVDKGDLLHVTYRGHSLKAPVWIQPGHAPDTVTMHLGFGRTRARGGSARGRASIPTA